MLNATGHAWLHMLMAGVHIATGDGAAALDHASQALELPPSSPSTTTNTTAASTST